MDNNEVLTLDLSSLQRKKILVNTGNELRELYLNLSDMKLIVRFNEKYDELLNYQSDALNKLSIQFNEDTTPEQIKDASDALVEIDSMMRDSLDYIFDANVSEVCAPEGSMYDMLDGKYRFECIIDALGNLYGKNTQEEITKMNKRLDKHTSKYTKKKS